MQRWSFCFHRKGGRWISEAPQSGTLKRLVNSSEDTPACICFTCILVAWRTCLVIYRIGRQTSVYPPHILRGVSHLFVRVLKSPCCKLHDCMRAQALNTETYTQTKIETVEGKWRDPNADVGSARGGLSVFYEQGVKRAASGAAFFNANLRISNASRSAFALYCLCLWGIRKWYIGRSSDVSKRLDNSR